MNPSSFLIHRLRQPVILTQTFSTFSGQFQLVLEVCLAEDAFNIDPAFALEGKENAFRCLLYLHKISLKAVSEILLASSIRS